MAYLVIEWLKTGDKVLKPPQLEALASNKVIALTGREEGKPVMMQFKDSLWQGKILSLHEKMSAAKQAVSNGCRTPEGTQRTMETVTPESADSSDAKKKSRERKKKCLGPDFESSWPEESCTSESDKCMTSEEKEELLGSSSSGESAEMDDEDFVVQKAKRRKQNEKKGSGTATVKDGCPKNKGNKGTKQTKLISKEQQLKIVAAECAQVKELVTIDLESGSDKDQEEPSNKRVPEDSCKSLLCAAEKNKLREEIKVLRQNLADYAASKEISAPGGSAGLDDEPLRYGKVPRQAALNRKWEEIGNGVWIDPLRLRAAQKEAKSKTAFARMLLMFFYKKEELKGKRLHELDQDIVHAIAEFAVIAKLQPKPEGDTNNKNGKEGKEKQPRRAEETIKLQSCSLYEQN